MIVLTIFQTHNFLVVTSFKFPSLLSRATCILSFRSNSEPNYGHLDFVPDLGVETSIRHQSLVYILIPNNASLPRPTHGHQIRLPPQKFASSPCIAIARIVGNPTQTLLTGVLSKILTLHKNTPTPLTGGSKIILHLVSKSPSNTPIESWNTTSLPIAILRSPFRIVVLHQTPKGHSSSNYLQNRGRLELGVRHSSGDTLFTLSHLPDGHPPGYLSRCGYPMWIPHPDSICSGLISLTQILGHVHNYTSRYGLAHETFRDGHIRHHKFITDPNSVEMNALHFMQASGYQVVFCENGNTGNWEKSFFFQLRTWTHPLHPWVWGMILFSALFSVAIQVLLFKDSLLQSLLNSVRIIMRQENDASHEKVLVTFSISAFFLLLIYEAEFTCSILVPEAPFVPTSLRKWTIMQLHKFSMLFCKLLPSVPICSRTDGTQLHCRRAKGRGPGKASIHRNSESISKHGASLLSRIFHHCPPSRAC